MPRHNKIAIAYMIFQLPLWAIGVITAAICHGVACGWRVYSKFISWI